LTYHLRRPQQQLVIWVLQNFGVFKTPRS